MCLRKVALFLWTRGSGVKDSLRAEARIHVSGKEEKMARKKNSKPAMQPEKPAEVSVAQSHKSDNTVRLEVSRREKIQLLAYSYWLERGCRGGSPEEDWFRAERELDLLL